VSSPFHQMLRPDEKEAHDAAVNYHQSAFEQLFRNGTWGCCVACPIHSGKKYPELCEFANRYDHKMTAKDLFDNFEHTRTRTLKDIQQRKPSA